VIRHRPVPLPDIRAAHERIRPHLVRTPLVRCDIDAEAEIYLKLENLQPIGAFKIRGAGSKIAQLEAGEMAAGVWTASAGNMAQAVAWHARRLGIPCTVVVPESAPATKRLAVERLGGVIIEVPIDEWLDVFETHRYPGVRGRFIHAFSDPDVMAGNATIGLEIVEDLPDVDAVVVPWGGGGLACGIASALRALRPDAQIYAAEFAEMAPLTASWEAGRPVNVPYVETFIDGIGAPRVFEEMFELGRELLDGSLTATVAEIATAVRLLVEHNRVVAEGAGATSVAAALAGRAGTGKVICIVSGGNIDAAELATILKTGQT
jgi:threonine dehydratase